MASATKRVSAYTRARQEAQTRVQEEQPEQPSFTEEVEPALSPIAAVRDTPAATTKQPGKIGRPKGAPKVKKTFYLTEGGANLEEIRLDLAAQARLLIKDESEVADLALALLVETIKDSGGLQRVVDVYNEKIKR